MNSDCAACYVAETAQSIDIEFRNVNWFDSVRCVYYPIRKWNATGKYCNDYHTVEDKLDDLINYIVNCITHRKKFNIGVYMSLRKAIMKKMYIVAHLEWGYEQNEV